MNNCANCGKTFGCSCEVRVASNGTRVCSSCLATYENKINAAKQSN